MKASRIKFIFIFLVSGFAFLFLYNVVIRGVVRGMPESESAFLGTESLSGWKKAASTILYPVKVILGGPMLPLLNLPDPPPPFLGIGFVIYWTILALLIYYLIGKLKRA